MACLYIVATPIGNLEDLTRRAERVLGEVAHVAAEDTRHTGRLLKGLGIRTDLVSLHAHNEASRLDVVLKWLEAGEDVALVSDAGTPLISDPGARLVEAVAAAGHPVVPVPGPSAALAALVASGLPSERFVFVGFLARKGRDRAEALRRVAESPDTSILFESPERLHALLGELEDACGGARRVVVAREMTKLHEEFRRGTATELHGYYSVEKARGEITVLVEGVGRDADSPDPEVLREQALALLERGLRPSAAARTLAEETGIPRNQAYAIVQKCKGGGE